MSAEKLVKYTVKYIAKTQDIDYNELKLHSKKVIKMAREFDQQLLGLMEDLLDLGNAGSIDELYEYDIEVLKMYCRIKDLDDTVSDRKIVEQVWANMQEEYELNDSEDSEESSDDESGSDESESETEPEPEPEPEPKPVKKEKKKKEVVVIE
jgi:hypothetical protein